MGEYQFCLFIPGSGNATLSKLGFEVILCFLFLVIVFGFWLAPGGLAWALSRSKARAAIPGPHGAPLVGLLQVFSDATPHRALAKLARRFNAKPLMAFSVGLTRFVISSQAESAKEILGSSAFADRPVKESAYELLFHRAMGFAPYGEYWRNLRRISSTHLFSPHRIRAFGELRSRIGVNLVQEIAAQMSRNGELKVKKLLHFASLNNVMTTVFGRCYDFNNCCSQCQGGGGGDGLVLEELVSEGYELLGIFNWSDHFPFLGWLDLQGVRRRSRVLASKVNFFVGKIIAEHKMKRGNIVNLNSLDEDHCAKDFVDVLLDLEKDDKLTDSDLIAVLWEMIFRGTDTVAILLEWILARMVLHPEIQSKAQSEIDAVVGNGKAVSDADVVNLPYVQAIVKETLRVHPPGPLLSWARLAIHDVHVGNSLIPAGTTAMVNMWAITHDENVWAQPEEFRPERFMAAAEDVNIMGSDLRLAPFGSGRRVCPGKTMGLATVHLWLAQLLQNFRWVAAGAGEIDLSESLKLSLEMKSPLVCKAVLRN